MVRIGVALLLSILCSAAAQAEELTPQWLSNELYCLARVVYGEARDQPEQAQLDVAFSVMNRKGLNRKDFGGDTACGVAFYPGQYHGVSGHVDDYWQPKDWDAWFTSLTIAWRVYTKRAEARGAIRNALYYLNPSLSSQKGRHWFETKLRPLTWSGAHRFYAEK